MRYRLASGAAALLLAGSLPSLTEAPASYAREPHDEVRSRGGRVAVAGERGIGPRLRIDLVDPRRRRTAPAPGWLAYDGAPYRPDTGYGWIDGLPPDSGADRGEDATIVLPNGVQTSPRQLARPELAHWQGTHRENHPLVFRVDLPDGWYRVTCTSVDPGTPLPLVDQRSFKCRARDVVFAGAKYGAPLLAGGMTLVEGGDIVEVTGGHLRVVIGDPAYAGWTWRHAGAWHEGWPNWFGRKDWQRYAESWYQKVTRTVDPGFHSLRLNSLAIEPVPAPPPRGSLVFRDVFDRDDAPDINRGVPPTSHWSRVDLDGGGPSVHAALDKAALALTGTLSRSAVVFIQPRPSPDRGIVRYSTRVSLFTGEGSRAASGMQEAGLLLLGDAGARNDSHLTFVGLTIGGPTGGALTVRVGTGAHGSRVDATVHPPQLPLQLGAGEYEIVVDHDIGGRVISRISVNGVDVTSLVPLGARRQRLDRGVFGIRAVMDPGPSGVVRQFYWFVRVECLRPQDGHRSCE